MEWPFQTVLPDGSVQPPTKIERINTFFENEMFHDHRVRETTFGIGKQPSFVRSSTSTLHTSPSRGPGGKLTRSVPVELVKQPENNVAAFNVASRAAQQRQLRKQKSYDDRLPTISNHEKHPQTICKPLFLPGAQYQALPRHRADVQPAVYHCAVTRKGQPRAGQPTQKHQAKPKLYTGTAHRLGKVQNLSTFQQDKDGKCHANDFTLNAPASNVHPSPEECLNSFREVRKGRKRYNVFWGPAVPQRGQDTIVQNTSDKSGSPQSQQGKNLIDDASDTGSARANSSLGSTKSSANIPDKCDTKQVLEMKPHKKKVTSKSRSGRPSGYKPSVSSEKVDKSRVVNETDFNKGVTPTPKLDLSALDRERSLGSDSDYNVDELGALDIVSSCSDSSSTCGTAKHVNTVPDILRQISIEHADLDEDFKRDVKRYVSDIIKQAYGRYEQILHANHLKHTGTLT